MYLNQIALWSPVISPINSYGDIENGPPKTISVRRQEHVEEVKLSDGTVHNTNYIYYTCEDVKVDDRLDGYLVISSYDMRSLGGNKVLRRLKTI